MRPPRFSLGALTNLVLLALFILAAVAFFPASWFFQPEWRAALVNDFGIQLPSTLTPQPWITLGYLVSFAAGLSWLYIVSTQDLELREVRFQLRLFTSGIALLAAICIALYLAHTTLAFWHNEQNFGPFPNRNQTGDSFRARRDRDSCLRSGRSSQAKKTVDRLDPRAGPDRGSDHFEFFAFWNRNPHGGQRILAWRVGVPTTLSLATRAWNLSFSSSCYSRRCCFSEGKHSRDFIFTISAVPASHRISGGKFFMTRFDSFVIRPGAGSVLEISNRSLQFFVTLPLGDARALHPESDWLWLWTELGWPAVVLTIVGIALLVSRVFPLRAGTNQGYRLAALIAALLFAIDGIVDVSGHQMGTAFAAVFLLGLSVHRPLSLKKSRWTAILFRFVGLVLLAAGLSLVVAARGEKLLPGSVGVASAKQLSAAADTERNFSETVALTTNALRWAPLDWELYLERAIAEVELKQTKNAVDDFRRARFLEPIAYEVPLAEGNAWLPYDPVLAVAAWREALRRAGPLRPQVYASMLSDASLRSPEVSPILEAIGLNEHDLALPYLSRISGARFNRALAQLLRNDPDLRSFGETEKLALFAFWSERGDPEEISRAVEQHPDWLRYAWLGVAKYKASKNDFRAGYELTQRYGEPVALPRVATNFSLQDSEKRFQAAHDNYAIGYELYRAQMQNGRVDDALLTARHFSERPNSPAYFHFLEAQCWAEKQNWERAWNAWQAFQAAQAPAAK